MTVETSFINSVKIAYNEKDIENAYRQFFSGHIKDILFSSPFGCDGFGESEKTKLRVLCEFKDDLDLLNKSNQIKVISQSIYYLKKFELAGMKLPTTLFVGDRNECFVMHVNDIFKYLGQDYDWSIAPSNAHSNLSLMNDLFNDSSVNPFIFKVEDLGDCVDKLLSLTEGVKRLIPITTHNITEVFKYFEEKVLGKTKLQTNEVANLFIQLLINPEENYLHPVKSKKVLVTKSFGEVPIGSKNLFESFFAHFSTEYSPRQKEILTSIVDRLVEDETRRRKGEFFTPTIWVDKAHEYISSVFGDDWKEKYVVWDPAWGTGNLTRDYKFKELYCSTLNQSDIDTANQMGYNPEATKFQFDFLNDDYSILPQNLKNVLERGEKIIVLMNPPYATSSTNVKIKKEGTSTSQVNKKMIEENMGKSSQQLYNQFIFRLLEINQINFCMFSPPLFLTGVSSKKLRERIFKKLTFKTGFVMNSSNFADVKSWPLTFSIFKNNNNV